MVMEKQIEIVRAVASLIEQKWDKVTLNVEIADVQGSETVSELGFIWLDSNSQQLILNMQVRALFRELRKLMKQQGMEGSAWSVCDLTFSPDGKYNFDFSYGETKRIIKLR